MVAAPPPMLRAALDMICPPAAVRVMSPVVWLNIVFAPVSSIWVSEISSVVTTPVEFTTNASSTSIPPSAFMFPVAVTIPPSAMVNTGVLLSSATKILDAFAALSIVRTVPAASVVRVNPPEVSKFVPVEPMLVSILELRSIVPAAVNAPMVSVEASKVIPPFAPRAPVTDSVPVTEVLSTREMFPVELPPRVRVLFLKLCIVELLASSTKPLLVEPAMVATGLSSPIPVTANLADTVESPPMRRSRTVA